MPDTTLERARRAAHSIPPVDLGSPEGIAVIAEAIRDAEQRAALELTREWGMVVAALATSVVESLEVVKEIELKPGKGHPFYRGQMSLLQTLRGLVDDDLRRYGGGAVERSAGMLDTPCEGCGGAGTYDAHAAYPDEFAPGERAACECCGGVAHPLYAAGHAAGVALAERQAQARINGLSLAATQYSESRDAWMLRARALEGAAALAGSVAALETELSYAHALLDAVRPVMAASAAMDAARHDVMAFVAATKAHEAATAALPAEARAWAEGEEERGNA